jgi:prepilin peptidase CpaA
MTPNITATDFWTLCWLVCCGGVLALSALTDLRGGRVPNRVVMAGALAATALAFAPGGVGWASALGGAAVGLLALMPLYVFRMMGAGDVKLLSVVGAFVGYPSILGVTLAMFVAGGGLAIVWAIRYGLVAQVLRNLRRGLMHVVTAPLMPHAVPSGLRMPVSSVRIPYALAIAAGACVDIWYSGRLQSLKAVGAAMR